MPSDAFKQLEQRVMRLEAENQRLKQNFSVPLSNDRATKERFGVPIVAVKTTDIANISAETANEATFGITGAKVGDAVFVSPTSGVVTGALSYVGYVSATGLVTLRVVNATDGAIDPPSGEYVFVIFPRL